MKVAEKGEEYVVLHITQFEEPDELVENRIAGWMERAMEIHGVEQLTVNITQSLTKGDPVTEIQVRWSKAAKSIHFQNCSDFVVQIEILFYFADNSKRILMVHSSRVGRSFILVTGFGFGLRWWLCTSLIIRWQ
jgi:hypothetical protein